MYRSIKVAIDLNFADQSELIQENGNADELLYSANQIEQGHAGCNTTGYLHGH